MFISLYAVKLDKTDKLDGGQWLLDYVIAYCFLMFLIMLNNYIRRVFEITSFNNTHLGSKNSKEINDFINRLLPKHIQDSINNPGEKLGSSYDDVTLLFADIVGFTAYSAGKTPKEVVKMLSELFTDFDKECNRLDLYKVYTIGDCYVVMGFLD